MTNKDVYNLLLANDADSICMNYRRKEVLIERNERNVKLSSCVNFSNSQLTLEIYNAFKSLNLESIKKITKNTVNFLYDNGDEIEVKTNELIAG